MNSEFIDKSSSPKEDLLILKTETIDADFLNKEEYFVLPGIVESLEINEGSVNEEVFENEEINNSSSSNVCNNFFLFETLCILSF